MKNCIINLEDNSLSLGTLSKDKVIKSKHHVTCNEANIDNLFEGSGLSDLLQQLKEGTDSFLEAEVTCILPYDYYLNSHIRERVRKTLADHLKCRKVIFLSDSEGIAHFLAHHPAIDLSEDQILVFDLQRASSEIYLIRFLNGKFRRAGVFNSPDKYFQGEAYPLLSGLIAELDVSGIKGTGGFAAWLKYLPEIGRQYQFWRDSGQQPDHDLRVDYLSEGELPPVELSKLFEVLQRVVDQIFSFDHSQQPPRGSCHLLLLGFGAKNPLFRDALQGGLGRHMEVESFLDAEEFEGAYKLEGTCYYSRREIDIYPSHVVSIEIPAFVLGNDKGRFSHYLKIEARNQPVSSSYLYTIPLEKVHSVQDISIQVEDSVIQSKINLADCLPNLDADLNESERFYKLVRLSARVDGCANVLMTVSDTTGLSREAVLTNLWEK